MPTGSTTRWAGDDTGAVSTVAGNGDSGYADGKGAAARFNCPTDVVVDKEGTIVVADTRSQRLRKIVGRQVTTLAGGSEAGTADGAGGGARFNEPYVLVLHERAPARGGIRPGGHAACGGRLAGVAGVDGPGGRGGGGARGAACWRLGESTFGFVSSGDA